MSALYKKPEPEEYDSPGLTLKKGRWSLWQENNCSTLWHQCSKSKEEVYGQKLKGIVVYPLQWMVRSRKTNKDIECHWACGGCLAKPPESILVPWMMHNFDSLAELMENDVSRNWNHPYRSGGSVL